MLLGLNFFCHPKLRPCKIKHISTYYHLYSHIISLWEFKYLEFQSWQMKNTNITINMLTFVIGKKTRMLVCIYDL